MSGYDIKGLIDRAIGHFWNESFGQIYPSLRRLEADGLAEGRDVPVERGPARREYAITVAGLEELRAWLAREARPDVVRYETSLRLFFGDQMPLATARSHVERYRALQVATLEEYRRHAESLEERPAAGGTGPAGRARWPMLEIVLDGGRRYCEMAIEWCDATLARLDSLDPDDFPAPPGAPRAGDDAWQASDP